MRRVKLIERLIVVWAAAVFAGLAVVMLSRTHGGEEWFLELLLWSGAVVLLGMASTM